MRTLTDHDTSRQRDGYCIVERTTRQVHLSHATMDPETFPSERLAAAEARRLDNLRELTDDPRRYMALPIEQALHVAF